MSAGASAAAKLFSPLVYLVFLLAAIFAALLTVRALESGIGYGAPIFLYVVAESLVAGLVLSSGGLALLSLEKLQRPVLVDHLRRCALLYSLFVPLGMVLIPSVDLGDPGAGGSLAVMLCVAAGYAIIIDAVLLFGVRRWSRRPTSGSYT